MPFKRAYNILLKELLDLLKEERLQIVIKAINNTAGPNSIIFALLVFGVFPRILQWDTLIALIIVRVKVIRNTIIVIREYYITRQIINTLRIKNNPRINYLVNLLISLNVLI